MVTLYVHLREQIAKRLHHRLSETIFLNTLTDVRKLKNIWCQIVLTTSTQIHSYIIMQFQSVKFSDVTIEIW